MSHKNSKSTNNAVAAAIAATPDVLTKSTAELAHEIVGDAPAAPEVAQTPAPAATTEQKAPETPKVEQNWFAWASVSGMDYASHDDDPKGWPGADTSKSGIYTGHMGVSSEENPFTLNICRAVANTTAYVQVRVYKQAEGEAQREQGANIKPTDKRIFHLTAYLAAGKPTDTTDEVKPVHGGLVWHVTWNATLPDGTEKTGEVNLARTDTVVKAKNEDGTVASEKVGQDKDTQKILRAALHLAHEHAQAWPAGDKAPARESKVKALKEENEVLKAALKLLGYTDEQLAAAVAQVKSAAPAAAS